VATSMIDGMCPGRNLPGYSGGGGIICAPNSDTSDTASFKDSVGVYIKGNGTICRLKNYRLLRI
jgi:hypothetical protein